MNKNKNISLHIGPIDIKNYLIMTEAKLNFNSHLDDIIKNASRKISALSRINPTYECR